MENNIIVKSIGLHQLMVQKGKCERAFSVLLGCLPRLVACDELWVMRDNWLSEIPWINRSQTSLSPVELQIFLNQPSWAALAFTVFGFAEAAMRIFCMLHTSISIVLVILLLQKLSLLVVLLLCYVHTVTCTFLPMLEMAFTTRFTSGLKSQLVEWRSKVCFCSKKLKTRM